MFVEFDKDKDDHLDFEEIKSFWIALSEKKKITLKVDENFVG